MPGPKHLAARIDDMNRLAQRGFYHFLERWYLIAQAGNAGGLMPVVFRALNGFGYGSAAG